MSNKAVSMNNLGWRHAQALLLFMGTTIAVSLNGCFSVAIVAMRNSTTSGSSFKQYDWDQSTTSLLLGSFIYGYTFMVFPAGYLTRVFGPKNLLAFGICTSSVVNSLIPFSANIGYGLVVASRVVMGLCQAGVHTCTVTLISRWTTPMERGRIGSTVLNGVPFGIIVGMSVSGLLAGSRFGWPSVFYFFGVLGIIWSLLFYWLGANYPSNHSKITTEELEYINAGFDGVNNSAEHKSMKVPWKEMMKSMPFWALVIARCGNSWGFWVFLTQLPTYLKFCLNYDVSQSGTVSALPYVVMWILGFPISFISDYALKKGVPTVYVRKTCAIIGFWIPALCMLILATVTSTDRTFIVAILVVAIGFNSATSCGHQLNFMELAPNYVSITSSFSGGVGNLFSLGMPYLLKLVIVDPADVEQWQIIFCIAAAIFFFSNLFFLIFGRCKIQAWNNLESKFELDASAKDERALKNTVF